MKASVLSVDGVKLTKQNNVISSQAQHCNSDSANANVQMESYISVSCADLLCLSPNSGLFSHAAVQLHECIHCRVWSMQVCMMAWYSM